MKTVFIINFKTYAHGTGHNALHLAKVCEEVARRTGADIRIAVEAADIRMIASEVHIPVYAQHIDAVEPGSHTGWILPECVKEAGAVGTLLNHSERKLSIEELTDAVVRAKEVGLTTVVCAETAEKAEQLKKLDPDFLAIEPPELIGGDISVTTADPDLITEGVHCTKGHNLLVGAGVKTHDDVAAGIRLGAVGVLVASGVVKADDPEASLSELIGH